MEYKINSSGTGHRYTKEEIEVVTRVMNEADPLTQGKYRNAFEEKFKEALGLDYCFAVNNATAALELAAQLCLFKPGDELIAPTHTFTSSVYPFIKKGANIRWADIDLKTRVLTAESIEKRITTKTRAILIVHLYGYLADMEEIVQLAKKHNLLIIEDVAQALGTDLNGKQAGSFGDFGIYSFHSHKNMTTLGEGGMLSVKNQTYANILPQLRHNGHTSFHYDRTDYWLPAMGNLEMPVLEGKMLWPNNYCLGEVECALGSKLLDRMHQMNAEKRSNALWFIDQLSAFPELEFHRVDSSRHNYHLLAAQVKNGMRNGLIKLLADFYKIKCDVRYYPLNRYPLYQAVGLGQADCPNTDLFFDNQICFPFEHWRSREDLNYIVNSTKDALNKLRNAG